MAHKKDKVKLKNIEGTICANVTKQISEIFGPDIIKSAWCEVVGEEHQSVARNIVGRALSKQKNGFILPGSSLTIELANGNKVKLFVSEDGELSKV